MSSKLTKRLLQELTDYNAAPAALDRRSTGLVHLGPDSDDNLLSWSAIIRGPDDSPFAASEFTLAVTVPAEYPTSPPTIAFKSKVFHPNVSLHSGEICLDLLKTAWSPVWTLATACEAIQHLLATPEPSSPLNVDAANLLRCDDVLGYESMAQMWVSLNAPCTRSASRTAFVG